MQTDRSNWEIWAQYLQHHKLLGLARFLLEAVGPIRIIAAQSLLMTRPFFQNQIIFNLAELMEDKEESKNFLQYLISKGAHE